MFPGCSCAGNKNNEGISSGKVFVFLFLILFFPAERYGAEEIKSLHAQTFIHWIILVNERHFFPEIFCGTEELPDLMLQPITPNYTLLYFHTYDIFMTSET